MKNKLCSSDTNVIDNLIKDSNNHLKDDQVFCNDNNHLIMESNAIGMLDHIEDNLSSLSFQDIKRSLENIKSVFVSSKLQLDTVKNRIKSEQTELEAIFKFKSSSKNLIRCLQDLTKAKEKLEFELTDRKSKLESEFNDYKSELYKQCQVDKQRFESDLLSYKDDCLNKKYKYQLMVDSLDKDVSKFQDEWLAIRDKEIAEFYEFQKALANKNDCYFHQLSEEKELIIFDFNMCFLECTKKIELLSNQLTCMEDDFSSRHLLLKDNVDALQSENDDLLDSILVNQIYFEEMIMLYYDQFGVLEQQSSSFDFNMSHQIDLFKEHFLKELNVLIDSNVKKINNNAFSLNLSSGCDHYFFEEQTMIESCKFHEFLLHLKHDKQQLMSSFDDKKLTLEKQLDQLKHYYYMECQRLEEFICISYCEFQSGQKNLNSDKDQLFFVFQSLLFFSEYPDLSLDQVDDDRCFYEESCMFFYEILNDIFYQFYFLFFLFLQFNFYELSFKENNHNDLLDTKEKKLLFYEKENSLLRKKIKQQSSELDKYIEMNQHLKFKLKKSSQEKRQHINRCSSFNPGMPSNTIIRANSYEQH